MQHSAKAVTATIMALAMASALTACGSGKQAAEPAANATSQAAAPAEAFADKPPPAFAQCMSCHSVEAGKNVVGPSLHGVVGRKAASLPGYAYSDALKASGLTWDKATLDKWLTSPAKLVPGTKMGFFGFTDAAKRKEVIDYLAKQK